MRKSAVSTANRRLNQVLFSSSFFMDMFDPPKIISAVQLIKEIAAGADTTSALQTEHSHLCYYSNNTN